ncbi:retropepsin-like aspartic protease [Desulfallas thermosapovorans]|uniref:Aspartyl protease n=1 Tax=Desulfallas thermosapovorans DSM 6562 TaxID=1121431 RepID=A0A5S4ZML8_9FIRM|nr:retropepsin-like aspartic protease [Desulfallas thermosapovorans]TYO92010.1 aspartyl protease [Desulfallas thermosapovorans DSM 6562]
MRLDFRDGLIFTSLSITYKGKIKKIENIILDTGAAQSIVSPDAVEELGITVEPDDRIVTCYGIGGKQYAVAKLVNGISFGPFKLGDRTIDLGPVDLDGEINGLLGMDMLMEVGAVIDLKNLLLYEGL